LKIYRRVSPRRPGEGAEEDIMGSSIPSDGFFTGRRGSAAEGWPGSVVWEALQQLRDDFERRLGTSTGTGSTAGPGDVRAAILALLAEKPMHGHQIIHEVEERSGGGWKPSPGSVYPTLQLLVDEGLIAAEESEGRKTYSLTDAGLKAADATAGQPAPWEAQHAQGGRATALPRAGIALAQAAAQVGRSGSAEQVNQAVSVLDEARRKLYSILAQE